MKRKKEIRRDRITITIAIEYRPPPCPSPTPGEGFWLCFALNIKYSPSFVPTGRDFEGSSIFEFADIRRLKIKVDEKYIKSPINKAKNAALEKVEVRPITVITIKIAYNPLSHQRVFWISKYSVVKTPTTKNAESGFG